MHVTMDLKEARLWDSFIKKLTAAIDVVYQLSSTTTQSQAIAELELRLEELQSHLYEQKDQQENAAAKQPAQEEHTIETPTARTRRAPARFTGPDVVSDLPVLVKVERSSGDEMEKDMEEEEALEEDSELTEEMERVLAEIEEQEEEEEKEIEDEVEGEEVDEGDPDYVPAKNLKEVELEAELEGDESGEPPTKKSKLSAPRKLSKVKAERLQCKDCEFSVRSAETMRRHQLRKHRTQTQCPDCELAFTVYHKYLTHLQRDHKNAHYECQECRHVFFFPVELKRHMKSMHTDPSSWEHVCGECEQPFPSKTRLTAHMATHMKGEKPFACDECPYRASQEYMLKKHKLNIHSDDAEHPDRGYQCDICDRRIKYHESFKVHMRRHKGERPFLCDTCPAAFPSQGGLARHKRIHGPPRHPCPQCGRCFHTPGAVTRHSLVHEAAAQTCRWCTFTTTFPANLRRHCMKIHNELWPPPSEANKRVITTPCIPGKPAKVQRGPRPEYDNNKQSSGAGVMRRRGRKPKNIRSPRSKERQPRKVVILGDSGDVVGTHRVTSLHKNIKITKSPTEGKGHEVTTAPQRSHIQVKVITEGSKENSMQLQVIGEDTGNTVIEGQEVVFMEEAGGGAPQYQVMTQYPETQYQQYEDDDSAVRQYEIVSGDELYSAKEYSESPQEYSEAPQYSDSQPQYQVLEGFQLQEGEQFQVVNREELEMLGAGQYQVVDGQQLQVIGGEQYSMEAGGEEEEESHQQVLYTVTSQ